MNSEELSEAIKQVASLENGGSINEKDQKITGFIEKFKSKE